MGSASEDDATTSPRAGCLIVTCGLPGSGKTTTSLELATEREGVRLSPDEWMATLDINLWDEAARERVETLQWALVQELLQVGAAVIIEWGSWARVERDSLRERARQLGDASSSASSTCLLMSCGAGSRSEGSKIHRSSDRTSSSGQASSKDRRGGTGHVRCLPSS
jgi:predicted kinase